MGDQGSYAFGKYGKTYEYMLTSPQAYLCNEIDYQINGKSISISWLHIMVITSASLRVRWLDLSL